MTTFFDTSALIALTKSIELHHHWSREQFEVGKTRGPILIAPIVFAEFSIGFNALADVTRTLTALGIESIPEDHQALFRASRAYLKYKDENRGPKFSLYPDFLVGALAETTGRPLVTTNERDFMKYFDNISLIHPIRP
jgi:predicted nucleic acid-binding protein